MVKEFGVMAIEVNSGVGDEGGATPPVPEVAVVPAIDGAACTPPAHPARRIGTAIADTAHANHQILALPPWRVTALGNHEEVHPSAFTDLLEYPRLHSVLLRSRNLSNRKKKFSLRRRQKSMLTEFIGHS